MKASNGQSPKLVALKAIPSFTTSTKQMGRKNAHQSQRLEHDAIKQPSNRPSTHSNPHAKDTSTPLLKNPLRPSPPIISNYPQTPPNPPALRKLVTKPNHNGSGLKIKNELDFSNSIPGSVFLKPTSLRKSGSALCDAITYTT